MEQRSLETIISYLKESIEPLEDSGFGPGYRVSAYLKDGTFLPSVTFRNVNITVELAMKRFKEEQAGRSLFLKKSSGFGYREIVKAFVTAGNCVNHYDIATVEESKYAFPISIIKQIRGETKMGWTGFVAKMKDGRHFAFGTDWHIEFFDMPDGYHAKDIQEIINHTYIDKTGQLKSYHDTSVYSDFDIKTVFRSKPFFECFVDHL